MTAGTSVSDSANHAGYRPFTLKSCLLSSGLLTIDVWLIHIMLRGLKYLVVSIRVQAVSQEKPDKVSTESSLGRECRASLSVKQITIG